MMIRRNINDSSSSSFSIIINHRWSCRRRDCLAGCASKILLLPLQLHLRQLQHLQTAQRCPIPSRSTRDSGNKVSHPTFRDNNNNSCNNNYNNSNNSSNNSNIESWAMESLIRHLKGPNPNQDCNNSNSNNQLVKDSWLSSPLYQPTNQRNSNSRNNNNFNNNKPSLTKNSNSSNNQLIMTIAH